MSKKSIIITICIISILLGVGNIVASSALATTGSKLQELQQEAHQLESQNQELERAIAANKSLLRVEARATELGLTVPASLVTLNSPEPVALLP